MNKKIITSVAGFVAGALGVKVLSSKLVKKAAVSSVAGGLRVKESLDKTIENIKVCSEDIVAEAKVKNAEADEKEAKEKEEVDINKVADKEEE